MRERQSTMIDNCRLPYVAHEFKLYNAILVSCQYDMIIATPNCELVQDVKNTSDISFTWRII